MSMVDKSLNDSKVQSFEQKLNNTCPEGIFQNSNYSLVNNRVIDLQKHLNTVQNQTEDKFKILKESIKAMFNKFEEQKQKENHLLEVKASYIKNLEKKIKERFDDEESKIRETENYLMNLINKKFDSLTNELNFESKNRYDCIENLKILLEEQDKDNPNLLDALNKEKEKRENNDLILYNMINQEVEKLSNLFKEIKINREQNEESLLTTIKAMINKAKNELAKEKKNRMIGEDNLLHLIEDAINKMKELNDLENEQGESDEIEN